MSGGLLGAVLTLWWMSERCACVCAIIIIFRRCNLLIAHLTDRERVSERARNVRDYYDVEEPPGIDTFCREKTLFSKNQPPGSEHLETPLQIHATHETTTNQKKFREAAQKFDHSFPLLVDHSNPRRWCTNPTFTRPDGRTAPHRPTRLTQRR